MFFPVSSGQTVLKLRQFFILEVSRSYPESTALCEIKTSSLMLLAEDCFRNYKPCSGLQDECRCELCQMVLQDLLAKPYDSFNKWANLNPFIIMLFIREIGEPCLNTTGILSSALSFRCQSDLPTPSSCLPDVQLRVLQVEWGVDLTEVRRGSS